MYIPRYLRYLRRAPHIRSTFSPPASEMKPGTRQTAEVSWSVRDSAKLALAWPGIATSGPGGRCRGQLHTCRYVPGSGLIDTPAGSCSLHRTYSENQPSKALHLLFRPIPLPRRIPLPLRFFARSSRSSFARPPYAVCIPRLASFRGLAMLIVLLRFFRRR